MSMATTSANGGAVEKIFVRKFPTHRNPHLDKWVSWWLIQLYGSCRYTGLASAELDFCGHIAPMNDAEFDRLGLAPIGIGYSRLDEHLPNGARIPEECSATLTAKWLNLRGKTDLEPLLEEVEYFDSNTGASLRHLSELIKVATRRMDNPILLYRAWIKPALDAIHDSLILGLNRRAGIRSVVSEWNRVKDKILHKNFVPDPKAREEIETYILSMLKGSDSVYKRGLDDPSRRSVTNLAYILNAMYQNGNPDEDTREWSLFAFSKMVEDQMDFFECLKICEKTETFPIQTRVWGKDKVIRGIIVQGDRPNLLKAARHKNGGDAQVVIKLGSSGNVIQVDQGVPGITLRWVARMIRWYELPKDRFGKLLDNDTDLQSLSNPGTHPKVQNWYYFAKGEQFFNGCDTHSATPTRIHVWALQEILMFGFDGDLSWEWFKIHQPSEQSHYNPRRTIKIRAKRTERLTEHLLKPAPEKSDRTVQDEGIQIEAIAPPDERGLEQEVFQGK